MWVTPAPGAVALVFYPACTDNLSVNFAWGTLVGLVFPLITYIGELFLRGWRAELAQEDVDEYFI